MKMWHLPAVTFLALLTMSETALAQRPASPGIPPTAPIGGGLSLLALFSGGDEFVGPIDAVDCAQVDERWGTVCWGDIPGMTGTINLSADGCVLATLSAQASFVFSDATYFRVRLDGSPMQGHANVTDALGYSMPGAVYFSGPSSHTFFQCGVTAGAHTINVQLNATFFEWSVTGRTLVVLGGPAPQ